MHRAGYGRYGARRRRDRGEDARGCGTGASGGTRTDPEDRCVSDRTPDRQSDGDRRCDGT